AFHQIHVVEQAALALLSVGVLPAARRLWGDDADSGLEIDRLTWQKGDLITPGRKPLARADIAAEIYRSGLVCSVVAHAVFMGAWVVAEFNIDGRRLRFACDGLSTRIANQGDWRMHDRENTVPPPAAAIRYGRSLYAPSGALVAVELTRNRGRVSVEEVQSFV